MNRILKKILPEHEIIMQLGRKPLLPRRLPDFSELFFRENSYQVNSDGFQLPGSAGISLMLYRAAAAVILVSAGLFFYYVSGSHEPHPRILAAYVRGDAEIERDGMVHPLKTGDIIEKNDIINLRNGAADFLLSPEVSLKAENARFQFYSRNLSENQKLYHLNIKQGRVTVKHDGSSDIIEIHSGSYVYAADRGVFSVTTEGPESVADVITGTVAVRSSVRPDSEFGELIPPFLVKEKNKKTVDEYIHPDYSFHSEDSGFRKQKGIADSVSELISRDLGSLAATEQEFGSVLHTVEKIPPFRSADFIRSWYGRNLISIHLADEKGLMGVIAGKTGDMFILQTTKGGKVVYSGDISEIEYTLASR